MSSVATGLKEICSGQEQERDTAAARPAGRVNPAAADKPPRESGTPLREWNRIARRTLAAVGVFSIFVNLLMLTLPIYLFQISDRVLTSRSFETLIMLTVVALGFLWILSLIDV